MLFRPRNTFCTFTLALSVVCVQCPIWLFFCISLISCFPGMLLRYCLSDFEVVPVAPIIVGITSAFTFRMRWISIMRSLNFKIYSASLLITFLSAGIATSINMHAPCLLSWIMTDCYYYIIIIIIIIITIIIIIVPLKTGQANHDPHPQPVQRSNVTTSHLSARQQNAEFVISHRSPQYLPFFHKSVRITDAAM